MAAEVMVRNPVLPNDKRNRPDHPGDPSSRTLVWYGLGALPISSDDRHPAARKLDRQPLPLSSRPDLQAQQLVAPIIAVPANLLQASAPNS